MYQQETRPLTEEGTVARTVPEFYLPLGGGTDPDFCVPEDRVQKPSRLSRWIHALPGFRR